MELIVRSGPDAGASVTVEGKVTIGREAEFRLTDPSVSRMHAAITPTQDGRAVLEDLGSSGGTMVNGSRISGPVFLVGGERIQLGANALELVVALAAGSPTIIAPTPSPTVMQQTPMAAPPAAAPPPPAPPPVAPPPTAPPPVAPPPTAPPPVAPPPSPLDPPTFAQPPPIPAVRQLPPPGPAIPFQPPPPPAAPPKRSRTRLVIAAVVALVVIAAAIVLLKRGGDEAPAANGGKDQASASVNPGGDNTVANLKGALGDFSADPSTWTVTLTWDDVPASFGLDHYEVTRDGKRIAANEPQPTFVDGGVAPGLVFAYSVIAVGKNAQTDPAKVQVTTPDIAIADAHVDGTWVVSMTVSKSTLKDIGQTVTQRWVFDPSCGFGSCDVVWTVQGKDVNGAIRADGENYAGTANAPFLLTSCRNEVIDETLDLRFTVQKTQVVAREFAAAALKGTLTETATAPGCKTATRTFDFTALRT